MLSNGWAFHHLDEYVKFLRNTYYFVVIIIVVFEGAFTHLSKVGVRNLYLLAMLKIHKNGLHWIMSFWIVVVS